MEIREIENKDVWEEFLKGQTEKTFLNSWSWGEFQEKMGNKIWRLGLDDSGELMSLVLVSKISAKRGIFLSIQHGPAFAKATAGEESKLSSSPSAIAREGKPNIKYEILKTLLRELKKIAREEGASFIRMNPLWEKNQENQDVLKSLGFREAPMHANAYEATLKLDLFPSEEELLGNMRKTTRYLIRQTMKNPDIEILRSDKIEDLELYNKLNQEVAKDQQFIPFSSEFIKNEFEVFSKTKESLLFFGKYRGELAAAALVIFWSGIGFYHQAALSPKYHKIPIAYLLQWEAIKEAKKRGCILYDFWGYVDPKLKPKHPWAGPSLFKMGFGGKPYKYVKTQDFPLSKKYWLTFVFEKIRKIKRGL